MDGPYASQAQAPRTTLPPISLADALGVLRRGWFYPLLGCLLGLLAALGYIMLKPPLYKSSARVLIDKSVNRYLQASKIINAPMLDDSEVGSQVYILSSESIILKVIREMDLTQDPEFVGRAGGAQPNPDSLTFRIKQVIKSALGLGTTTVLAPGVALERRVVDVFNTRLVVMRADVPSVIEVTFSSEDAIKAAKIANAIADAYVERSLGNKLTSTEVARRLLEERLVELKSRMKDADERLNRYRTENGIVNESSPSSSRSQLQTLNSQLTLARISVAEAKARLDRLLDQIKKEGSPGAAIPESEAIRRLRMQYLELAERESELAKRVGERHEAVRKLRHRMEQIEVGLRQEEARQASTYESDYHLALARENEIAATLEQATKEANSSSHTQIALKELEQSAASLHALYDSAEQKYNEINKADSDAAPPQDVRVITRAAPSLRKPIAKPVLALFASVMGGFLLGGAAVLGREFLRGDYRSSTQVGQATGFYCVSIETAAGGRRRRRADAERRRLSSVLDAPFSRFTEAFRQLKAMILDANRTHDDRVFCIASSLPGEGKTFVAGNLGALLATSSEKRMLLIDGDLHRSSLTARLAPDATKGLIEALETPDRLGELVHVDPATGVHLLPSVVAERDPNSSDILGGEQMDKLISAAREAYDLIVIDAPPILSVVDIRLLSRFVDKFIFVIKWRSTSQRVVAEALGESDLIQDRMLCMTLNNINPQALRAIEAYKGRGFDDYYVRKPARRLRSSEV